MAWSFQGPNWSAVNWSLVDRIRIRKAGGALWYDVGEFTHLKGRITTLTKTGDPSATEIPYAVQYTLSFALVQSSSAELAHLDVTLDEGLFLVEVEIELRFIAGKVLLLGAGGYPLRLIPDVEYGNEDGATLLPCNCTNMEPLDSIPGKFS